MKLKKNLFNLIGAALIFGNILYAETHAMSNNSSIENKLETCEQIFKDNCKNCSEQPAVLHIFERINDAENSNSEKKPLFICGELLFSPSFFVERFGFDSESLFKNIGCEIEGENGAKFVLRPHFNKFGDNAIILNAEGDCAQIKIFPWVHDEKWIPKPQNLDNYRTGTNEFKFDCANDEKFELVDGATYNVSFFKVEKVNCGGEEVDFNPKLDYGNGKSSFKPEEVVLKIKVKAKKCEPDEVLYDVLEKGVNRKIFSEFKHPELMNKKYCQDLINEHERTVKNKIESKNKN